MFTNYALQAMIQNLLAGVALTPPTDLYFAVSQTTPTQAQGAGVPWNFTEPSAQASLTTALVSGTAYTSLAVSALDQAVAAGDSIVVTSGADTQTFTASAAAAVGATSIAVTSLAANFAYPVGSLVADGTTAPGYGRLLVAASTTDFPLAGSQPASGVALDNANTLSMAQSSGSWSTVTYGGAFDALGGGHLLAYFELRATSGTLSTASGTTPITALAVTALTIAVASGATVRLISGTNTQEFTASAAAAVGATSIAVVSQAPDFNFPVGTDVNVPNPLTVAATTTVTFPASDLLFVLS